ncbi:MAG TPA: DUF202 domain-containing protein [Acidimicrobiales bacterium]|nr:DUF202 domain-containing protein [Acidimicrobiales bacterium]
MSDADGYHGVADPGLQQERTALAWERTAISSMAAGILLARFAAANAHPTLSAVGVIQSIIGAVVLVWAGLHYDDLHLPIRSGRSVVHPSAARLLGLSTVVFSGFAFVFALIVISDG